MINTKKNSKLAYLHKKRGFQSIEKTSIPRKVISPESWELFLQYHRGVKSRDHFDLRLWDPKDSVGHSWAMRNFPAPGKLAITHQARPHDRNAFDIKYVKDIMKQNVALVLNQDATINQSGKNKIVFDIKNTETGNLPKKFTLKKVNNKVWIFRNQDDKKHLNIEGLTAKEFIHGK